MGASTHRAGCRIVANRARCCVVVREQFVRRTFQLCVCFDSAGMLWFSWFASNQLVVLGSFGPVSFLFLFRV